MEHKGTIRLETDRLLLRPFRIEDAKDVFDNWASDDEVTKYLTWPTHSSVEMSRSYMEFCINGYNEKNVYQWGIELKNSHELIGNISVVKIIDEIDSMELGWVIGRKWWGNGYTAETAERLLKFLFTEVGANRICARHDINNPNSGRVMQKIGMRYEGTLRQSGKNNQGIVDMANYSVLREEWKERS
ncbi:GNAT family N-acetyltransferase [Eubacterium sp. MSJ-13]|uniref:GNAT family N-acetyltransferase n=1 Tax=Eubacterium sp. MSJ-13 TaxID=2841513 RepID=UPI001C10AA83|nr:GNAT family N-acetyltransferase [Eubacterium sp. MSJ-13]MBU5478437.1 GNAT family N-acetyltransferase [Eubacterium sp. MSJ-13]